MCSLKDLCIGIKVRTIYEDTGHDLYFIREKGSLFTSTLTMDRFRNRSVFSTLPDGIRFDVDRGR